MQIPKIKSDFDAASTDRFKRLSQFLEKIGAEITSLDPPSSSQKAKSTIFCAVYSKDPSRYRLIEEHFENILRVNSGPQPLYVFEDNDFVPDFVKPYAVVLNKAVTIYEAWRVATHICQTKFIGNLNLDDRFTDGGFEAMESALERSNFDLVGGEWLIDIKDFSETKKGELTCTFDLSNYRRIQAWPPEKRHDQILGSGISQNGSFGPATLWRSKIHDQIDYPTRFHNGQKILSMGDSCFWRKLARGGYRIGRLPALVGVYNSDPLNQAEFRETDDRKNIRLSAGRVL